MAITREEVKKHGSLKKTYFARADRPGASDRGLEIAVRLGKMSPTITSTKGKKKKGRSRVLDWIGGRKTQTAIVKRRKKMQQALETPEKRARAALGK